MSQKTSTNILAAVIVGAVVFSFATPAFTEDTEAMKSVQGESN